MGHNALKTPFVVVTWDRSNSSQKKKNAVSLLFQIGGHMQKKYLCFHVQLLSNRGICLGHPVFFVETPNRFLKYQKYPFRL